ncbi:MAG: fibronectin type III domain-containing protein [Pseudomonadota bacterium]
MKTTATRSGFNRLKPIIATLVFMEVLLWTFSCCAGSFTLAWDAVSGTITGYRIYYKEISSQNWGIFWQGSGTSAYFDNSLLQVGKTYSFVVRAVNGSGESLDSNSVQYYVNSSLCPDCSGGTVLLTGKTFPASVKCVCYGSVSISAGSTVTVKSQADVTFKAPAVHLGTGFKVEEGAKFNVLNQ